MRRKIQIGSLWVLIFSGSAWALTFIYSIFIPQLRPVLRCMDTIVVAGLLVFTVSSWWNTIRRFFKRVTNRILIF